ncbi:hypothetical protein [Maricaulis sp.]|uniref:hypothetical protein n=1 Tax=Maricaulis sp. TaxID=1486257 RepID=UPI003A8E96D9
MSFPPAPSWGPAAELFHSNGKLLVEFDADGVVVRDPEHELNELDFANSALNSHKDLLKIVVHLSRKSWVTTSMIESLISGASDKYDLDCKSV